MSTLAELVLIAVGSAIVNNVVLSQFLGICPFLGVSKKTETAAGRSEDAPASMRFLFALR